MGLTRSLLSRAGVPAVRALAPCCVAAAAMLASAPARSVDDLPPPLPAFAPDASAGEPPADQAAGGSPPAPPAAEPAAVRAPEPAPAKTEHDVRIEQKHVGRRVSEVIVTPAGFTYHYTMIHLDDQDRGTSPLQPHTELSVPRFFRIDF
jgi:hypothetical protein